MCDKKRLDTANVRVDTEMRHTKLVKVGSMFTNVHYPVWHCYWRIKTTSLRYLSASRTSIKRQEFCVIQGSSCYIARHPFSAHKILLKCHHSLQQTLEQKWCKNFFFAGYTLGTKSALCPQVCEDETHKRQFCSQLGCKLTSSLLYQSRWCHFKGSRLSRAICHIALIPCPFSLDIVTPPCRWLTHLHKIYLENAFSLLWPEPVCQLIVRTIRQSCNQVSTVYCIHIYAVFSWSPLCTQCEIKSVCVRVHVL